MQFRGILDGYQALGLGNVAGKHVQEGGLSGAGPPRDQDADAGPDRRAEHFEHLRRHALQLQHPVRAEPCASHQVAPGHPAAPAGRAGFTFSQDRSQLMSLSYSKGSQTLLGLNYGYKNGQANCGTGTTNGNDGLIHAVDANQTGETAGNELWTVQFGTAASDFPSNVVADATGVYVIGNTLGTFPGATRRGREDVFVSRFDGATGAIDWTTQLGTRKDEFGYANALGPAGLYVNGFTDGTLPECPQFKIMRIDGSLFFGAVNHVEEAMQHVDALHPQQKHLMVVAKGINFVDIAGAGTQLHILSGDLWRHAWLMYCICAIPWAGMTVFQAAMIVEDVRKKRNAEPEAGGDAESGRASKGRRDAVEEGP